MFRKRFYYLIKVQYLGFRYHGWQKQPEVNTLQRMIERTIRYVLQHSDFKILAAGRTDAKVSANEAYFELFVDHQEVLLFDFFEVFNQNLPQDIRAIHIEKINKDFNIIQHPKIKEYIYLFSFGSKFHPFCAPLMYNVLDSLNIEKMKKAASIFEGEHDFRSYCHRPNANTETHGKISTSEIVKNTLYTASFFPKESYLFRVKGSGFKRNQIRLMMGVLLDLGEGKIDIDFIKQTLVSDGKRIALERIVPGSGLILQNIEWQQD